MRYLNPIKSTTQRGGRPGEVLMKGREKERYRERDGERKERNERYIERVM